LIWRTKHSRTSAGKGLTSEAMERPAAGIVVVRFSGWDAGEFGDMPMLELAKDLTNEARIELLI